MQLHRGGHRPPRADRSPGDGVCLAPSTQWWQAQEADGEKEALVQGCRELQLGVSSWGSRLSFRPWAPLLAVPSALSHSSFAAGSTGLNVRQLPRVRSLFSPRPLSRPSELVLLPLTGFSQGPLADRGCQGHALLHRRAPRNPALS